MTGRRQSIQAMVSIWAGTRPDTIVSGGYSTGDGAVCRRAMIVSTEEMVPELPKASKQAGNDDHRYAQVDYGEDGGTG